MLFFFWYFLQYNFFVFFFFFQAEDGIRDLIVTGVQTCALPISLLGQGPEHARAQHGRAPRAEVEHHDVAPLLHGSLRGQRAGDRRRAGRGVPGRERRDAAEHRQRTLSVGGGEGDHRHVGGLLHGQVAGVVDLGGRCDDRHDQPGAGQRGHQGALVRPPPERVQQSRVRRSGVVVEAGAGQLPAGERDAGRVVAHDCSCGVTTASSSISTSMAGSRRPATTTMVAAGRTPPSRVPWARPTASQSARSVTYIRVRTTSASVPPSRVSAARAASRATSAWAPASPGWVTAPSTTAVQPETCTWSPTRTARA